MIHFKLYALVLASLACIIGHAASDEEAVELPLIWASTRSDKSYHILYQMEVANLDEILAVEEWASFDEQLFRLDIISGSSRTSYLTYGKTGERFRYKPYICDQFTSDTEEFQVLSNLFLGYPLDKPSEENSTRQREPVLAHGLGPLWLRARSHSLEVKLKVGPEQDLSELDDGTEEYEVTMRQDVQQGQLPFKIRFYFSSGAYQFVDSVDWISEQANRSEEVEARAKVLHVDWRPVDKSAFKLPIGHGCMRNEANDEKLQIDVGIVLLHAGVPNQVNLDITTSWLDDEQVAKWSSRRYSMRVMRSSRVRVESANDTESFYATEVQERSEQSGRMVKSREIWWLPRQGADRALVYSIEQASGECSIDHREPGHLIGLRLGGQREQAEEWLQPIVKLSGERVAELFGDNSDYHLVDEGETLDKRRFRNRLYEKRLDYFELGSGHDGVHWRGPVSIVKQISSAPRYLEQFDKANAMGSGRRAKGGQLTLNQDYRTTLSIFFFAKEYTKLLYKATIDLIGNHEVDYDYVHEQLDVSQCYASNRKQDITVKYPLASPQIWRKLREKRQQLRVQAYLNLFEQHESFLSPLQVANIRPSFDAFYMQLEMTLVELPASHSFEMKADRILEPRAPNLALRVVAANAERCSEHCELHNCRRFSYYPFGRSCVVELVQDGAEETEASRGELYWYVSRNRSRTLLRGASLRSHFSAQSLVAMLKELTMEQYAQAEEQQQLSAKNCLNLELSVDGEPKGAAPVPVVLRPSAIEHRMDSMNEYVREQEMLEADDGWPESGSGEFTEIVRLESGSPKLEYRVIGYGQKFKDDFGKGFKSASYEECEQLCAQNDCRSFSYCAEDESCRLTWAHKGDYVRKYLVDCELYLQCQVYSLDYLSKFESFGQLPLSTKEQRRLQAAAAASVADCASSCMDDQSLSCQGFYFCQTGEQQQSRTDCYLTERHASGFASEELRDGGGTASGARSCEFFSRSYLAQFDKYLGKTILLRGESWLNRNALVFIDGEDSEVCAKRCIEHGCLAFRACPMKGHSQTCALVMDQIKKEQIRSEPKCTTFVLSDKSQFNAKRLKLVESGARGEQLKPDVEASPGGGGSARWTEEAESGGELFGDAFGLIEGSGRTDEPAKAAATPQSHWSALVGSFAAGLVLGSCFILAWNQAYARGWLDRIPRPAF